MGVAGLAGAPRAIVISAPTIIAPPRLPPPVIHAQPDRPQCRGYVDTFTNGQVGSRWVQRPANNWTEGAALRVAASLGAFAALEYPCGAVNVAAAIRAYFTASTPVGVFVRGSFNASNEFSGYAYIFDALEEEWKFVRYDNNVQVLLDQWGHTAAGEETIELLAVGDRLRVYRDGSPTETDLTDATHTSGHTGILSWIIADNIPLTLFRHRHLGVEEEAGK